MPRKLFLSSDLTRLISIKQAQTGTPHRLRYQSQFAPESNWLRGKDLNLRPSGYEPDELPDCSTPRLRLLPTALNPPTFNFRRLLRCVQSAKTEIMAYLFLLCNSPHPKSTLICLPFKHLSV